MEYRYESFADRLGIKPGLSVFFLSYVNRTGKIISFSHAVTPVT